MQKKNTKRTKKKEMSWGMQKLTETALKSLLSSKSEIFLLNKLLKYLQFSLNKQN